MSMNEPLPIIHAEEWGYGSEPLLLLHGFMMRGEMFYPLIEPLGLDFRMLIPDLRGFGNSKGLPPPYSMDKMTEDLIQVMDLFGLDKVHLLGYSMGGVVAQKFALKYPNRLKSLSLCCTFAYKAESTVEKFQRQMIPTVIKRLGAKGLTKLINNQLADIAGKVDVKTFIWYKKMLADNIDEILLECANELFKSDFRNELKNIKIPTFVVGASSDLVAPIHHSYLLAGKIPNAKIKIFNNAGHGVLHSHTQLFVDIFTKFALDNK